MIRRSLSQVPFVDSSGPLLMTDAQWKYLLDKTMEVK